MLHYIISILNKFERSNFWSGWCIGIAGYFIAASYEHPDNEWLYVGIFLCLLGGWLLKERPNEGIRNTGYRSRGSSSVLP
jgi:hypothetical protein